MSQRILSRSHIDQLEQRYRANFINCLSGFKSANLIGSRSSSGVDNLCIVSSVFHVGANPPLLGMIMRPHTVKRDTLENIKDTKVYTINHVNDDIVRQAHQSAANYASELSEFDETGLSSHDSSVIDAPYVQEAHIKMSMQLKHISKIELNETELVIGEIVEVQVPQASILDDGFIDIEQAKSICVSGLDSYHTTQRIDRFSYAKPSKDLNSIWSKPNRKR